MTDINLIFGVSYGCLQFLLALGVSIAGAIWVRDMSYGAASRLADVNADPVDIRSASTSVNITTTTDAIGSKKDNPMIKNPRNKLGWNKLGRLWMKVTWKMRSVYIGLFVHSFDVLTDLLVIYEWLNAENKRNIESIDSKLMAYWSIGVIMYILLLVVYLW